MKKRFVFLLAMVLVLALVLLAGCGGDGVQEQPAEQGEAAGGEQQQPAAATEMVVGIPALTNSFDFFNTTNGFETFSMAQVYDTLVVKDDQGQYVGALAERYETSEDAKTFTFHLRQNAKWSDGTPVTADDVKFSMDQLTTSDYTSWIYQPLLAAVNVLDEYTVEIVLTKSSVSLLEYLANPYYCAILSQAAYEQYGDQYGTSTDTIVSSGPYRVTDWSVGEYISYEANEDYYLGAPEIKKVKLTVMTDSSTAMYALQTGEINAYFNDVPGVSYDTVSATPGISVVDFPSTILYCAFFNTQNGLFSDLRMRQAVAKAINKEDYIIVGVEGFGTAADYPGDRGAGATTGDPNLHGEWDKAYAYNLEEAKQLVEAAGNTGKSVVIKTYSTNPYPALATVLQEALNKIGLNASIEQIERSTFISQVLAEGDFEIQVCRWAAGTEDMDEIIYGSLHTDSIGAPGNWSFYGNTELDGLISQAAAELDAGARQELYAQIVRIYLDEAVYIPLYYPTSSRAYNDQVTIEPGYVKYDKFCYYNWSK